MKATTLLILLFVFFFTACNTNSKTNTQQQVTSQKVNDNAFNNVLTRHLNAVSNKDLETLKSTLSPSGNIQLILPKKEITNTAEDFIKYHEEWFALPIEWTFDAKVLNTKIGKNIGMAVVEIIYKEPLRGGKPYFNRMIVSYDLEKINGTWYFIKDHASSVNKSTDEK